MAENLKILGARSVTPDIIKADLSEIDMKSLVCIGITSDNKPFLLVSHMSLPDLCFLKEFCEVKLHQMIISKVGYDE